MVLSPATLDAYEAGITQLVMWYPDHRGVIFCADEIMRPEVWQATYDELLDAEQLPTFRPWDHVIRLTMYGSPVATPQSVHWWYTHVVGACLRPGNALSIVQQVEGTTLLPLPQGVQQNFSTGNSLGNTGRGSRAAKKARRGAGPAQGNWQKAAWSQPSGQWQQPRQKPHKGGGKDSGGKGAGGKGGKGKGGKGGKGGKPDGGFIGK
jgi:hypothetical protein